MDKVTDYSADSSKSVSGGKKISRPLRAVIVGAAASVIVAITSRNDVLKDGKQKASRGMRWFLNFGIITLVTFGIEFFVARINGSDEGSIFNARLRHKPSENIKQEMNASAQELNRRA